MAQQESSVTNFGLVIAYLVPGFMALLGAASFSSTIRSWLSSVPPNAPTVGGFLYLTIGSIAAGLTVSTVRWAIVDTIHHWTGVAAPSLNFAKLGQNTSAFTVLIEIHYRYYQFYSNMLVSIAVIFTARRIQAGGFLGSLAPLDLGLAALAVVFFLGSRDTLKKYYARTSQLLAVEPKSLL